MFFVFAANSQDTTAFKMPRAIVKFSPLYFFSNTFEMGLEAFNADYSRSFNVDIGFRSDAYDYDDGTGFNLELAYRRYVAPMKLHTRKSRQFYQGIYYSIFLRGETFYGDYYEYNSPQTEDYQRVNSIAPGFTLGLQKTLWEIIFLDVYFGGGVKMSDAPEEDEYPYYTSPEITQPGYEGIFPRVGAKIGVRL